MHVPVFFEQRKEILKSNMMEWKQIKTKINVNIQMQLLSHGLKKFHT